MTALITVLILFIFVLCGVHISYTLMSLSFVGIYLVTHKMSTALSVLSTTSFNAIRTYTYCVIPLFMLMGTVMAVSGSAGDLFRFANRMLRKVPGGLAAATVIGNAIFAAVTGVSVAAATVFAQIAIPEMKKFKYDPNYATGIVCGSANLGMIIPPSLFFIVYGTVAQVSIGKLFVGGVLPGILMASIFIAYAVSYGKRHPEAIGLDKDRKPLYEEDANMTKAHATLIALPIMVLILIVLGGIWGGFFTPTEASAIGCLGAFIIALCKKSLNWKKTKNLLLDTSKASAGILILLVSAQMYSRLLSVSGAVAWVSSSILNAHLPNGLLITIFLLLVLALGCVIDGNSIILLTTPIIQPVMAGLGYDQVWWGVIVVMAVCVGQITPPFGTIVFSVKGVLGDIVDVSAIFKHAVPYIFLMLLTIILCIIFPIIPTFLPNLM
jgi:tripartite ATP-independent transporter DctM subunit